MQGLGICRVDLQINSTPFSVPKNDCDQFTNMGEEKIFSERAELHKKKSHRISRRSLRVHTSNANSWLLKRRGLSSYGDKSQHASYRGPCQQPAGHVIPLHPPFNDYLLPLLDQENGWEYLKTLNSIPMNWDSQF